MSTSSWRANSRHVSPNHPVDYRHITRWTIAKYPCKLSPNHPRGRPLRGASEAIRLPNPIMRYLPRIVDSELSDRLQGAGAVVIEGPRACGKTSTARRLAASEALLDTDGNARRMVDADPSAALAGAIPRLFDEWQVAPSIWNHVRRAVDDRSEPGQFILTGSAVPADDVTRHTGAGRFSRLRMRPMSLFELGISSGDSSLGELLDGNRPPAKPSALTVSSVAEVLSVGGWPGNLDAPIERNLRTNRDYLEEIRRVDLPRVDGKARDPVRVGRLLRSLARNVATPVSVSRLASDAGGSDRALKADTAADYLDALERLMVVENQPAWSPHLRSRTALRTTPVRHFTDPSLAVAALKATPARLMADLRFLGFLFESLVVRDLRIYAQAADAEVFHYREKDGLEVDAIVDAGDGRWAAFEVKLGDRWVDAGVASLLRLRDRLRGNRDGYSEPSALCVIVPGGGGYRMENGVSVVPVGALGP